MARTYIVAAPGSHAIQITREFNAPAEVVLRAHTDPDLVIQWLGPRNMTMRIDTYEARDGGSYRYVHVDDDGNEYGFRGVFHGEPSFDGMVQTFEFEGMPGHVAMDSAKFVGHDGKTTIHTVSVYQSVEARDAMISSGMEQGMDEGYERLDELLARS